MEQEPDIVRHRLYVGRPKRVPPFDSAFVQLHDRDAVKLLIKAAPDVCHIVALTDGTRAAYALKLLHKRNFILRSISLEFDLHTILPTGRVVYLFTRGSYIYTPLSRYFSRGESMLHELSQSEGNVIDMFCFGQTFHHAIKQRDRGKSIVFVEE